MPDTEQQLFEGQQPNEEQLRTESIESGMHQAEIAQQEMALEEETEYANQLALEKESSYLIQISQKEVDDLLEEGRSLGRPPSAIKYFLILFILAIPNDLIDLAQLIGWLPQTLWITVLAWFISQAISAVTIFIFWFTDVRYKNAKKYTENLEKRVVAITANLTRLEGRAIRGARVIGKVPGMANAGARLEKSVANFSTKIKGSPTIKAVGGTVAEVFPFISILPWSSISVAWSAWDERKAYKITRESAEKSHKQLSQSVAEVV